MLTQSFTRSRIHAHSVRQSDWFITINLKISYFYSDHSTAQDVSEICFQKTKHTHFSFLCPLK